MIQHKIATASQRSTQVLMAGVAAAALSIMIPAVANAQSPGSKDVLYDTHTAAKGSCPGMDWHVVVHPDKTASGMVSWDGSKHLVHMTGTVDDQGDLKMNATDTGSNRTDTVKGTIHGKELKASINGTGTPCDNETMNVPCSDNGVSKG